MAQHFWSLKLRLEDGPIYQGEVLHLLDTEPAILLPARYSLEAISDGMRLNVFVHRRSPSLSQRLEGAARQRKLPIAEIALHDDLLAMPKTQFARALLHETVVVRDEMSGSWTLR